MSPIRPQRPDAGGRADEIVSQVTGNDLESTIKKLSDLPVDVARELRPRWAALDREQRLRLVQQMVHDAQNEIGHNFDRALAIAMDDEDATVREVAIEGLWETSSAHIFSQLINHAQDEPSPRVRSALARVLGQILAESRAGNRLDERQQACCALLGAFAREDDDYTVRNEALAAFAYCQPEDIGDLIRSALESEEYERVQAALKAIGRSDASQWKRELERALEDDDEEIRAEAATAIGLSGDDRFLAALIPIATEDHDEPQIAAITALGEIGGPLAIRHLSNLQESDDEAVREAAQEALDAATLLDSVGTAPHRPDQQGDSD